MAALISSSFASISFTEQIKGESSTLSAEVRFLKFLFKHSFMNSVASSLSY